jgi:hypothetical protein
MTSTKRDLTLTVEDPGATFEPEGPDNGTRLHLHHDKDRAEWRLDADRVRVYDLPRHPADGPGGPVRMVRYTLRIGQRSGQRVALGDAKRFSAKQLEAYGAWLNAAAPTLAERVRNNEPLGIVPALLTTK